MTNKARFDLSTLTKFQEELHRVEEGELINSTFADVFQPSCLNSSNRIMFKRNNSGGDKVDYTIEDDIDYIVHCWLAAKFPSCSVKEQYKEEIQIAVPNFLGIQLFSSACLRHDSTVINTIQPESFYMFLKYIVRKDNLPEILKLMGYGPFSGIVAQILSQAPNLIDFLNSLDSIPDMTVWGTHIAEKEINVLVPFYYTWHFSLAYPFFLHKDKTKLVHRFTMQTIDKLIRMRQKVDEVWKLIPFDGSFLDYTALPTPELFGRISTCEKDELHSNKCDEVIRRFYDDFIVINAESGALHGTKASINLTSECPCKLMAYYATDTNYSDYNNYANFTTNPENPCFGETPIESFTLKYGADVLRLSETTPAQCQAESLQIIRSNFLTEGMGVICFDNAPHFISACSGVVFNGKNAVFAAKMKKESEDSKRNYLLSVILLVTKKIVFTQSENDPNDYVVTVEPNLNK